MRSGSVVAPEVGNSAGRVAELLLRRGPSTAADLAEALQISAQAIRRHLDHLVDSGLAQADEEPPFGRRPNRGRGRPAKVYSLTRAGREQFAAGYDDLAAGALAFIAATVGSDALVDFARERAEQLVGAHRQRIASAPDPVGELAAVLTEQGYSSAVVDDGRPGLQLCQHHCPVAGVAQQFPQLCEAESAEISEVLGRHVTRLATIAHGDGVCTLHVPRGPDPAAPAQGHVTQSTHESALPSRKALV